MTPAEARVGARVAWELEPDEDDDGWRGTVVDPTERIQYEQQAGWASSWRRWTREDAGLVIADGDNTPRWIDLEELRLLPDEAQP